MRSIHTNLTFFEFDCGMNNHSETMKNWFSFRFFKTAWISLKRHNKWNNNSAQVYL